jgi:hypothetical protein
MNILIAPYIAILILGIIANIGYAVRGEWNEDLFWERMFCIIVWPLYVVAMLFKGMISAIVDLFLNWK